ncbi:MAG: flagellar motor protein MotB [Sphingomonas sp.]|nr:flagellar motor protein MotB [Sphingomonas sp.]
MNAAVPRWAVSFADLGLLLIGCFVMLHAMESARPKADGAAGHVAAAPFGETYRADTLFELGEARLNEDGRATLAEAGERWAGRPLRIVSRGGTEAGLRLDRFELAAARSAAAARVLGEHGVDEGDIEIRIEDAGDAAGQAIAIVPR